MLAAKKADLVPNDRATAVDLRAPDTIAEATLNSFFVLVFRSAFLDGNLNQSEGKVSVELFMGQSELRRNFARITRQIIER